MGDGATVCAARPQALDVSRVEGSSRRSLNTAVADSLSPQAIAAALLPRLVGSGMRCDSRQRVRTTRCANAAIGGCHRAHGVLRADSSRGDDGYRTETLTALGLSLAPLGDSAAVRWARAALQDSTAPRADVSVAAQVSEPCTIALA